ncbi:TPA: type VI secretion system tip protein VgrG [Burkholderia aenigmatica]|uniref:type VI secretion system Vgr family protein n=1 Tax=Burkholderia sp. AU45251 TaxID=3059204 RepID=UPI00264C451F|nr:type VI secretion system Vgr family protein [Burkholderia sp. AU45251]HDR9483958.1 type VI secretion system tip protein VgrG [Burkholderia aenigmatica]MDN7516217.1 type VI secretion system Vgr family protein [Burkholderia sp. AU45251]HDR9514923.1 type VI secretion system tip protein VgrG [Burkholderia aenigmatica]HDR9592008.1 type VI secretion system tip protein VgrG [Burkholderia aenigmatica]HDR9601216.1 type VI secretion system tip protein VgrG [Burkholderia aenigmatica]
MGHTALYKTLRLGDAQYNRLVKLDTPLGVDWLLPLYVKGTARLGRDYEFEIDAVSPRGSQIELSALLAKPVTLWIQQANGSYMPIHGYVHRFSRLGADGPLTFYKLAFSSWLYFLRLRRDMRDWQEQNGEQILTDVFDQHPQARGAYRFDLHKPLPSYSNRVQWEYDLNFVHRSLEEVGVFPYFEQADNGRSHTMVLTDDVYFVPQLKQPVVEFGPTEISGELDGFAQWKEQLQIDSAQLTSRSFDYKRPDLPRQVQGVTDVDGKLPTDGEIYDYPGAYMWSDREQGERLAQIRLEERKSRMKRFHGIGGLRCAMPGRRFELRGHPVHDAGSQPDREFVLLGVDWLICNNLPGLDEAEQFPDGLAEEVAQAKAGATVRHADGSEGFFQVMVEAQPRNVPFRSPFEHKKPVMQLQNAIVAGPSGEEVYTDSLNRVKVWFHWNRRNGQDERASCWVRPTFLDAGSSRGGIQPLRKGDEVVVGFMEGDCDRPVIIARMYGGATQPVWHTNGLLSGQRSREYGGTGYNQLVMDDSTQQNRVHLYSSSYQSHLHLGYLIQQTDNTRGAFLGSGFDLKSDAYGAIRAGQGLFVSTHPTATNQPLNVTAASEQLASAETVVDLTSQASSANQAESLQEGQDALKKFTDATHYGVSGGAGSGGRTDGGGTGNANGFSTPIMLMASPAGVGLSTQESAQVTANQQVNIVSGKSVHVAAGKSLIASVMEKISLFAQNAGIKLFAAKGKVEIQAKSDAMALTSQQDLSITSVDGRVVISADKEIWIGAGGSYIKITPDLIENGTTGQILEKGASWSKQGASSMRLPAQITSVTKGCSWQTASASANSASTVVLE